MYLNGLLSWPTVPKSKISNEEAGSINVCYLSLEIRSRVSEHCHEVKRSIGLVVDQFSWLIDSLFGEKCWLALRDVLECFVSSKTRRKQKILTFKVLLPIKSIRIDSEHSQRFQCSLSAVLMNQHRLDDSTLRCCCASHTVYKPSCLIL